MSNEIELEPQVVANLLAQINTPQHLESPEPLDEDVSTPNPPSDRPDLQLDQASSRLPRQRHRPNVTTMEERLMMMPERRPLPWRDGVEPGADNETGGESRRKQIRFGCLLATRGDIQEVPCNSCANGRGKFKVCVALEGYFKGACASCQLSGRPNRCSIKEERWQVLFRVNMRATANSSQGDDVSTHLAAKGHREPTANHTYRVKGLNPSVDELQIQYQNGRVHDLSGNKNWETRKQGST
jgi:hypothetical protein